MRRLDGESVRGIELRHSRLINQKARLVLWKFSVRSLFQPGDPKGFRLNRRRCPKRGDKGSGCEARTVPATVHRQLCSLHDNSHWSHFEIGKTASYALEPEVRKPCLLLYGSDHLRSGKGRVASSADISVIGSNQFQESSSYLSRQ